MEQKWDRERKKESEEIRLRQTKAPAKPELNAA